MNFTVHEADLKSLVEVLVQSVSIWFPLKTSGPAEHLSYYGMFIHGMSNFVVFTLFSICD